MYIDFPLLRVQYRLAGKIIHGVVIALDLFGSHRIYVSQEVIRLDKELEVIPSGRIPIKVSGAKRNAYRNPIIDIIESGRTTYRGNQCLGVYALHTVIRGKAIITYFHQG